MRLQLLSLFITQVRINSPNNLSGFVLLAIAQIKAPLVTQQECESVFCVDIGRTVITARQYQLRCFIG